VCTSGWSALVCLSLAAVVLPASAKTPQEIFEGAAPSIVVVEVHDSAGKLEATGSGVVIATGEVITNCHVAQDGKTLIVRQGKTSYAAHLHFADRDRDMCQLAVPTLAAAPVVLGDILSVKTGAHVVAIGAPEGLELSVSEGLVSSLRDLDSDSRIIQTTAAISPGSSGGALLDDDGRLVGITTFYLTEGQNLNFALPVNWIAQVPSRDVKKAAPTTPTSLDWLGGGVSLQKKNDWPAVTAYSRRWTQAEPRNTAAWNFLGDALLQSAQYAQAIDAFRETLRINPKDSMAQWSIGYLYYQLGNYAQARDAELAAVRIEPKNPIALEMLGMAFSSLGQYGQAVDAYQERLRVYPKDATISVAGIWFDLGISYDNLREHAEAIDAFREALRIDPKSALTWLALGSAYAELGQYSRAVDADREGLAIEPKFAQGWYNLGICYGKLLQIDRAIDAYRMAVTLDSKFADAWFNLGLEYWGKGDRSGAIEAYQSLRALDPAQADKLFNLAIAPR
jgi:tetratricopeptide (TPR) repeat protein